MKRSSRVQRSYERSELEKAGQVSHRAPLYLLITRYIYNTTLVTYLVSQDTTNNTTHMWFIDDQLTNSYSNKRSAHRGLKCKHNPLPHISPPKDNLPDEDLPPTLLQHPGSTPGNGTTLKWPCGRFNQVAWLRFRATHEARWSHPAFRPGVFLITTTAKHV